MLHPSGARGVTHIVHGSAVLLVVAVVVLFDWSRTLASYRDEASK